MSKNSEFHQKSFDNGTTDKLDVYRDYLRAWFPVFLNASFFTTIQIFDFFAGPGHDAEGNAGSPRIAIDELKLALEKTPKRDTLIIKFFFNEFDKSRYEELEKSVIAFRSELEDLAEIYIENQDFSEIFNKSIPLIRRSQTANLIFMDQFGIKQVSKEIFCEMVSFTCTDFLFFISSSIVNRMIDHPCITKYIPAITEDEFKSMNGNNVHRIITAGYQRWIPESLQNSYFLGHFSIKKGSNVYGLIFGSGHPSGIHKFIDIIHQRGGDANFDIDGDDINPCEPFLFEEYNVPTRLQLFRKDLESAILSRQLCNNMDIYMFCLRRAIKASHAKDLLREMINAGKLPAQKVPPISYIAWKKRETHNLIWDEREQK